MAKRNFEIEQINTLNDDQIVNRRHVDGGTFADALAKAKSLGSRPGFPTGRYAIKIVTYLQPSDFRKKR